ncbi:MAG: precorrin-6y C5,15-methyltransferase (decarboxylating) subunit CbiE [Pseudonocardia sp.]
MTITVIGLDGDALPPGGAQVLRAARCVYGSRRHLESVTLTRGTARHELAGVDRAALQSMAPGSVLLASGDPGFFGVVRLVRELGVVPAVFPARSSVATAFARIGRSWDDVAVVSAHGRDLDPALNVCRARAATAVLTAPGAGPAEIGAGLAGWTRTLVVAERLGAPGERVVTVDAADAAGRAWDPLNVVLCLGHLHAVPPRGWHAGGEPVPPAGGWALPEDAFAHRAGMVTKAEVRALVLARLAPRPGTLVWDVGAGSGSVAVESARLGAAAVAVERRPDDAARIAVNARTHGVDVRVVTGEAPAALAGLPRPGAVFVGGGGPDVVAAVAATHPSRIVTALAALDRIAPVRDALRRAGYTVDGVQLAASRLAPLPDGAVRLAATNPVTILWGTA